MPVSPLPSGPAGPSVSKEKCWIDEMYRYDYLQPRGNASVTGTASWMGIPELLLVNTLMGIGCIILFTFIRKRFWDYGRIACRIFKPENPLLDSNYDVFAHVRPVSVEAPDARVTEEMHIEEADTGLFTWLHLWADVSDEEILLKSGPSALQYLQFQNVIIFYMSVVTQFCLVFLLPLNLSGTLFDESASFARTTIANLDPSDPKLFVHCVVAAGLFIYGLHCLRYVARSVHVPAHWRHYSHGMPIVTTKTTVMISNLPSNVRGNEALIRKYFGEAYKDFPIEKVLFAYNVHELQKLISQLNEAETALKACKRSGTNELITTRHCRLLNMFTCRRIKKVRALQFYTDEVARLKKAREKAVEKAKKLPLPICFVTFEKSEHADKVVADFHKFCQIFSLTTSMTDNVPKTSLDGLLYPQTWKVFTAPKAGDIIWENLSIVYKKWISMGLNVCVMILLVVLSTPSFVIKWYVDYLERLGYHRNDPEPSGMSPLANKFFRQMVPAGLHLVFAALLPYAIEGCEEYSRHETRSEKEVNLMIKSFIYLLFMILLLPSFGLVSGVYVIVKLVDPSMEMDQNAPVNRWECLFLPDNPAFFINFVISSAVFGMAIQLLRPGHIVYYLWQICASRSRFEMDYARTSSVFRFPYGGNYAQMGAIFATCMAYCVACPLIAPCAFLYFCLKNQVDRYNIYFVFESHYVPPQMHRRAANCLLGCTIFSQGALIAFTVLRQGGFLFKTDSFTSLLQPIFMVLAFAISLALFMCQLFTGWFFQSSKISPFQYLIGEIDSEMSSSTALAESGHHHEATPQGGDIGLPTEAEVRNEPV